MENNILNIEPKKKYFIQTFGCQMNEEDSEKLCGMLNRQGYVQTENKEEKNEEGKEEKDDD